MLNPTPVFGSRCDYVSWQKFLSNEDEILFLDKIAKIVDDRLTERLAVLNDRFDEEVAA
jgi:hypothetical protein